MNILINSNIYHRYFTKFTKQKLKIIIYEI